MNIILTILSVLALFFFFYYKMLEVKKSKLVTNLDITYLQMEMYFIENNIFLNNNLVEYLKVYKNISVNPGYLNIQVLLLSKRVSEKSGQLKESKRWFKHTSESLPKEFHSIVKQFDKSSYELIKLSMFTPDFLWFLGKNFFKYQIVKGVDYIKKIKKEYKFIIRNDEAITHSTMGNLGFA